jgi:hypothetical protein
MQQDPTMFAIDQLVRLIGLEVIQAAIWVPLLFSVAWAHARWSRT